MSLFCFDWVGEMGFVLLWVGMVTLVLCMGTGMRLCMCMFMLSNQTRNGVFVLNIEDILKRTVSE